MLSLLTLIQLAGCNKTPGNVADTSVLDTAAEETEQVCNTSTSAIPQSDSTLSDYGCAFKVTYDEDCADKVYGAELRGVGEIPAGLHIVPPDACDSSNYTAEEAIVESEDAPGVWLTRPAYLNACPDADPNTKRLTCNSSIQAASDVWTVYLPDLDEGCEAYGEIDFTFWIPSEDHCDPPADTPDDFCEVATGAEAQFVHRNAFDQDDDGILHTHILPVMTDGTRYTERTWLRSMTVTDWGDSTHLYILKRGYGIHYDGDQVLHDDAVVVLTPSNPSYTWTEGEVFMGTTFATDSFPAGQSFDLPKVEMDFSCGVESPAHFQVVEDLPQAYLVTPQAFGFSQLSSQPVKLRVFPELGFMTLELEGRFHDRIEVPIEPQGSGWSFDHRDGGAIGFSVAGSITPGSNGAELDLNRLWVRGVNLGSQTTTLPVFDE